SSLSSLAARLSLGAPLAFAVALPGCESSPAEDGGSAEFIATTAAELSAADIRRVTVTVSGPGIATPISQDLVKTGGQWRGTLAATAHDADLDPLTTTWTALDGRFSDGSALSTSWTAPATEGDYALTLQISDGHGATGATTLTVHVAAGNARGRATVSTAFNT